MLIRHLIKGRVCENVCERVCTCVCMLSLQNTVKYTKYSVASLEMSITITYITGTDIALPD